MIYPVRSDYPAREQQLTFIVISSRQQLYRESTFYES